MATLYIMVGIPGSGKSLYSEKLDGVICSSDKIREELYGSEEIIGSHFQVFGLLEKRVQAALETGQNAIYDATNLRRKQREKIVEKYRNIAEKIVIVFMKTSVEVALERNGKRDRKVPENVIRNMYYYNLQTPTRDEADEIIIVEEK